MTLKEDWVWIVNHAWSARFLLLALILSTAETFGPHFLGIAHLPPDIFAGTMAIISGLAYFSRLVAQQHPDADPEVAPVLQEALTKVESEAPPQ